MMKYRSQACPAPSAGTPTLDKKNVVPNQSISLQEILLRFTRNEALPVGNEVHYHESEDDLEKVKHMDLVDRYEFIDKLKETQERYQQQERLKAEREKRQTVEKAKAEILEEIEKQKAVQPPKAE